MSHSSQPNFQGNSKVAEFLDKIGEGQQPKVADVPFFIEVQPTDTCNFACHYCSYEFRRKKSNYTFWDAKTSDYFLEFISERSVPSLCLSGGGEPLTWKYIVPFLDKLNRIPGLNKMLITNGALIEQKVPRGLLDDFSLILISIASTDELIYRQTMRGTASKDGTFRHVMNLPALFKNERPDLHACVVVSHTNYKDLEQVAIQLINQGFSYVYFKAAYNYEFQYKTLSKNCQDIILNTDLTHVSTSVLEKSNFLSFLQDSKEKECQVKQNGSKCINLLHFLNIIIDAAGDVYSCIPTVGNTDYCFGNIRSDQLVKILTRTALSQHGILQKLHKNYHEGKCGRCRFKRYNTLMLKQGDNKIWTSIDISFTHENFI